MIPGRLDSALTGKIYRGQIIFLLHRYSKIGKVYPGMLLFLQLFDTKALRIVVSAVYEKLKGKKCFFFFLVK